MLSRVRYLMLPVLILVKQLVVGWASSSLLYYVSLSLDYLCVYYCNRIVGRGMCHFGGMRIGYMLGIYHV